MGEKRDLMCVGRFFCTRKIHFSFVRSFVLNDEQSSFSLSCQRLPHDLSADVIVLIEF